MGPQPSQISQMSRRIRPEGCGRTLKEDLRNIYNVDFSAVRLKLEQIQLFAEARVLDFVGKVEKPL
jgi:hypothetical protein